MNKTALVPTKRNNKSIINIFNGKNGILILFLIIFALPTIKKWLSNNKTSYNFLNFNKINSKDLQTKIKLVEKVGPYLPYKAINIINTIMPLSEGIVKVLGLVEFMNNNKPFKPIKPNNRINNKEKMNKILSAIEEDIPDEQIKKIKPMIDIASNMDKVKAITNMVSSLSNPNKNNSNQFENIIEGLALLIGKHDEKSVKKVKDMVQMVQLMSMLNEDDEDDNKDN